MIRRVAIIGAGLMGHGLALVFADGGYDVAITDPDETTRATVKERVGTALTSLGKAADALDRISVRDTLEEAARDADLLIEAVPEKLTLKQDLFERLEQAAPLACILASNTSVIPIGDIAARVASKSRVAGTHWWNPPYLVPLVEVIETQGTSKQTVDTLMRLLEALGKVPVHVRKDVPGFVGNRLQHALWREAIALVAEGVCDAETIDLVVKNSFGRRLAVLGPMENADLVGTDLALDIQSVLLPHLNRDTQPTAYLAGLVRDGKLGFKSGQGFKSWTEDGKAQLRARLRDHLITMNKLLGQGG